MRGIEFGGKRGERACLKTKKKKTKKVVLGDSKSQKEEGGAPRKKGDQQEKEKERRPQVKKKRQAVSQGCKTNQRKKKSRTKGLEACTRGWTPGARQNDHISDKKEKVLEKAEGLHFTELELEAFNLGGRKGGAQGWKGRAGPGQKQVRQKLLISG